MDRQVGPKILPSLSHDSGEVRWEGKQEIFWNAPCLTTFFVFHSDSSCLPLDHAEQRRRLQSFDVCKCCDTKWSSSGFEQYRKNFCFNCPRLHWQRRWIKCLKLSRPIIAVQSDLDCAKADIEGHGDIFEFLDEESVSLSLNVQIQVLYTPLFVAAAIKRKTWYFELFTWTGG